MPKEGDEAVERMRQVYDKQRKLMLQLMREVGFGIPVMPQGAFYVFADASRWTDDSYQFAFELPDKAGVGVPGVPAKRVAGRAQGVDFGQTRQPSVPFSYAPSAGGHNQVRE